MKKISLLVYTFSHFAVDYICFWILYGAFKAPTVQNMALGFIIYNFIAFGLQMVIGAYCDEKRDFPSGAVGCAIVSAAVLISYFSGWAGVLICALGNAFFHVGGGIDSLVHSGGKLFRCGIFVSAGALGVVLGTLHASKLALFGMSPVQVIKLFLLGAFCGVFCYLVHKKLGAEGSTEITGTTNEKAAIGLIIALALVSVLIRSFGGTLVPMEWKTGPQIGIFAGYAAFIGKFIGGFFADIFGAKRTGVISLLLSLPLLILGREYIVISLLGIILFNMTMPITLGMIAEKMPENPGTAFGLTTAALLLGAVPSFFVALGGNIALLIPSVIISAVCMFFAAGNKNSVWRSYK